MTLMILIFALLYPVFSMQNVMEEQKQPTVKEFFEETLTFVRSFERCIVGHLREFKTGGARKATCSANADFNTSYLGTEVDENPYIIEAIKVFGESSVAAPVLFTVSHESWKNEMKLLFKDVSDEEALIEFHTYKLIQDMNDYLLRKNIFKKKEISRLYAIHHIKKNGIILEFVENSMDFHPKCCNEWRCKNPEKLSRQGYPVSEEYVCQHTDLKTLPKDLTDEEYEKLGNTVVHTTIMDLLLGIADNKPANFMYNRKDGFFRIDYGFVMSLEGVSKYPHFDTDIIRLPDPVWSYMNDHRVLNAHTEKPRLLLAPVVVKKLKTSIQNVNENWGEIQKKIPNKLYRPALESFLGLRTYRLLAGLHSETACAKMKSMIESTTVGETRDDIKFLGILTCAASGGDGIHKPLHRYSHETSSDFWVKTITQEYTKIYHGLPHNQTDKFIQMWHRICGENLNCLD